MPHFISKLGEWEPGVEKVSLINHSDKSIMVNGEEVGPGEPFIYKGKDRAALAMLKELNEEKLGSNYRVNRDLINLTRQLGFGSLDEYLKFIGFDEGKSVEKADKEIVKENLHKKPEKVKENKKLGGGEDKSGMGQHIYGGFGTPDGSKQ